MFFPPRLLLGLGSSSQRLMQAHVEHRPTWASDLEGFGTLVQRRQPYVFDGVTLGTGEPRGTMLIKGDGWSRHGVGGSLHRHHLLIQHSALHTLLALYR